MVPAKGFRFPRVRVIFVTSSASGHAWRVDADVERVLRVQECLVVDLGDFPLWPPLRSKSLSSPGLVARALRKAVDREVPYASAEANRM